MRTLTIATALEILGVSLRLGLTSFGGPVAHLGYFHTEYVRRRQWLDERTYADLVALAQFLPGPASSQVGIGIGVLRGGLLGGVLSFLGFTLPSVVLLVLFALLLQGTDVGLSGWVHGLKIVAVAIVLHALLGMGPKLAAGRARASIALLAAVVALLWQTAWSQVAILAVAGVLGWQLFRDAQPPQEAAAVRVPIRKRVGVICLVLFVVLLLGLPILRDVTGHEQVAWFDSFYRSGSLVFGGGHVVLPLLEREVVPTGWISKEAFLAGYGATQAVPGPLFTFAAYLGATMQGVVGAVVTTIAVFLPAFLLMIGTLPFWDGLRRRPAVQGLLTGVNAAVVGLLLAALYDPIFTSTIGSVADFALGAVLFGLLTWWKLPPWLVVVLGAFGGVLIG